MTAKKRANDEPSPARQADRPAAEADAPPAETTAREAALQAAGPPQALTVRPALGREQIDLIRRTLCPGATDDELRLFVLQCNRTGLDPFSRQIHAVKRRAKDERGQWVDRLSIQVGVDGFRVIAERSREMDGQEGPLWCGPDGQWLDVWLSQTPPAAAKVVVYRRGQARGYAGVALFSEYAQQGPMWQRMPAAMLAKCAECLALRKAFPADLSGLYAPEEMGEPREEPPQPTATAVIDGAHVAGPAPTAPAPLAAQSEESPFHRRLQEFDAKLSHEGLCREGDLVKHVAAAAREAGFFPDMTTWGEAEIKLAREKTASFERAKLLAEVDHLLEKKGVGGEEALHHAKAAEGATITQLDTKQLRRLVEWLRPQRDAKPGGRRSA